MSAGCPLIRQLHKTLWNSLFLPSGKFLALMPQIQFPAKTSVAWTHVFTQTISFWCHEKPFWNYALNAEEQVAKRLKHLFFNLRTNKRKKVKNLLVYSICLHDFLCLAVVRTIKMIDDSANIEVIIFSEQCDQHAILNFNILAQLNNILLQSPKSNRDSM